MTISNIKNDIQNLNQDEWVALTDWLFSEEKPRREAAPLQEASKRDLIMHLRDLGEIPQPDALRVAPRNVEDAPEWEHPKDEPQNCYCHGDIIQHEGKLWRSTYEYLNCSEPGTDTYWEEIPPTTEE